MSKEILLTQNMVTLVDNEDYEELNKYNWQCEKSFKPRLYTSYVRRNNSKNRLPKNVLMHRQIMDCPKNMVIDHINGNGLDNRKSNLRICTRGQNLANQRISRANTSGYRGVCWHKGCKKWASQIKTNNKQRCLGFYDNIIDAAIAYDNAALKYFGEFAYQNITKRKER